MDKVKFLTLDQNDQNVILLVEMARNAMGGARPLKALWRDHGDLCYAA